jgi:hypothetical protein
MHADDPDHRRHDVVSAAVAVHVSISGQLDRLVAIEIEQDGGSAGPLRPYNPP